MGLIVSVPGFTYLLYKQMFDPLPHLETPQKYNMIKKKCDDTKQSVQWRSEARTQENHKKDHDGPD